MPVFFFKMLVGVVLLVSAARFMSRPGEDPEPRLPSLPLALLLGVLGMLASDLFLGSSLLLSREVPPLLFSGESPDRIPSDLRARSDRLLGQHPAGAAVAAGHQQVRPFGQQVVAPRLHLEGGCSAARKSAKTYAFIRTERTLTRNLRPSDGDCLP